MGKTIQCVDNINNDNLYYEIVLENRIGRFSVTEALLTASLATIQKLVFNKTFIVRAERLYSSGGSIEYVAFSELFEKRPLNQVIPEYQFIFKTANDGNVMLDKVEEIK